MTDWVELCHQFQQRGEASVIVSIASVKGSSPREPGARMLVTRDATRPTIGGGNLEFQAIDIARKLLAQQDSKALHKRFSLAAGLGQCCGGVVTLLFEKVTPQSHWIGELLRLRRQQEAVVQVIPLQASSSLPRLLVTKERVFPAQQVGVFPQLIEQARQQLAAQTGAAIKNIALDGAPQAVLFDAVRSSGFTLYLFGAGHVGAALAGLLAQQPCKVIWVDTRDDQLPQTTAENISPVCTDTPEAVIAEAAADSFFLVMTHDHRLDQQLAEHILKRNDFAWFGLIGSRSKRAQFEHRLQARGVAKSILQKMVCPIGIDGIKSKLPDAIAVSVMAQLLQVYEQQARAMQAQTPPRRAFGR